MNSQESENRYDENQSSTESLIYSFLGPLTFNLGDLLKVFGIFYSLLLMSGGCIFVIYFFSISYMPNLSWESSDSLLFTAAIVSMILIIMIAIIFISPGIIWLYIIDKIQFFRSVLLGINGKPKGFIRLSVSAMFLLISIFFIIDFFSSIYSFKNLVISFFLLFASLCFPYSLIKASRKVSALERNNKNKNYLNKVSANKNDKNINADIVFKRNIWNRFCKFLVEIWLLRINIFKLILTGLYPSLILMILPAVYIFIAGKERIQVLQNQGENNLLPIFLFCSNS